MRDFDIRLALKTTALKKFYCDDSVIVEELSLPTAGCRIDIAVVNGAFHGYEIKSASDTLKRLETQISGYTKIFDFLTILTEEKHLKKVETIVPEWVGLESFKHSSNGIEHSIVRASKSNISTEGFYLAKLLRKDELQAVCLEFEISFNQKLRSWTLCEILADNIETQILSTIVRAKLKQRLDWKINSKAGLRFL